MPVTLDATAPDFDAAFEALLTAKREDNPDVDAVVAEIIADVRARGDAAVIELTQKFDRLSLSPETLRITTAEVDAAVAEVSPEDRRALELAADRIRAYHARQLPEDAQWTDPDGATLGWRAMHAWSPAQLSAAYGDEQVVVGSSKTSILEVPSGPTPEITRRTRPPPPGCPVAPRRLIRQLRY